MRNSSPSANASSRQDRLAGMSWSVFLVIRIFSRLLRRLKSSNRLSHNSCLVITAWVSLPDKSYGLILCGVAWTALLWMSVSFSSTSHTCPCRVRWGMGRMPECLALFTSMARMKLFPSVSFPFAFFTALSKSDECPMFMQVVSTKVMSYIPSAVRLVNRETSSMVGSGKVSGTSQAPAKVCPWVMIMSAFRPIASRQEA